MLDINEDGMYPEARQLRAVNFDARTVILRYLTACTTLHFFDNNSHDNSPYGITRAVVLEQEQPQRLEIQISIAAELIWPLLNSSYSGAEKDVASFFLASTLRISLILDSSVRKLSDNNMWIGQTSFFMSLL